jgi:dihydrolipoamide dehydrogenase
MSNRVEIKVPAIGDFSDVDVIEVLVKPGDTVKREDSLITLESDKASIEVPSPEAGVVMELKVQVGDKVSAGTPIVVLEKDEPAVNRVTPVLVKTPATQPTAPLSISSAASELEAEVAVLGGGPGGYTAAFRAADLGKNTVLIERYPSLGGVCLNVGCIPSKALLHVAKVIDEAAEFSAHGIEFGAPRFDLNKLRAWKDAVVGRLAGALEGLARRRKVKVVRGVGRFVSAKRINVGAPDGALNISFEHAIIAAGSQAARIADFPYDDPRIMDSTDALNIETLPKRLLVIGGGIIGLEIATFFHSLGSRITVVELTDGLLPGCDRDLVEPLYKRIQKRYENIFVSTKVSRIEAQPEGLTVYFQGDHAPASDIFDRVLVAVGRRPNGLAIGAERAGVRVNELGFVEVDKQMRTNVPHLFAIGDIVGPPLLAHKATHEGKVAAEVIVGVKRVFDARVIPSVAFTDPEVAWVGVTETEARAQHLDYGKGLFPWAASGRSLTLDRNEGLTKILFDGATHRIIGAGIVGPNAGDLISEAALAIEMGADAEDISLTIHPHPTLSETLNFAAEAFEGTITDLYMPKRK